ncbi:helix-turn-helix transcriptional regulator [Streptosporangium vulgare]|uniref:response regulator transcription factor n=1 Tax=Streptosporangium vulgare TaxID=46190 RepID=UPI0031CE6682
MTAPSRSSASTRSATGSRSWSPSAVRSCSGSNPRAPRPRRTSRRAARWTSPCSTAAWRSASSTPTASATTRPPPGTRPGSPGTAARSAPPPACRFGCSSSTGGRPCCRRTPPTAASGRSCCTGRASSPPLIALFEQTWGAASPLGEERRRDEKGLSGQEREVLRLLSTGLTDEAVARRLDVSVRTLRRVTAELMERLDARSRFQAGYLAAARGWLPSCL